jgi:hypothetical protein
MSPLIMISMLGTGISYVTLYSNNLERRNYYFHFIKEETKDQRALWLDQDSERMEKIMVPAQYFALNSVNK